MQLTSSVDQPLYMAKETRFKYHPEFGKNAVHIPYDSAELEEYRGQHIFPDDTVQQSFGAVPHIRGERISTTIEIHATISPYGLCWTTALTDVVLGSHPQARDSVGFLSVDRENNSGLIAPGCVGEAMRIEFRIGTYPKGTWVFQQFGDSIETSPPGLAVPKPKKPEGQQQLRCILGENPHQEIQLDSAHFWYECELRRLTGGCAAANRSLILEINPMEGAEINKEYYAMLNFQTKLIWEAGESQLHLHLTGCRLDEDEGFIAAVHCNTDFVS